MKPTTLYRLYSDTFELLYVGIASNPWRRFEQHAGDKPWWGEVAHVRTVHFPDRENAARAEVDAIRTERPRYNVAHAVPDAPPQIILSADQIRAVCSDCGDLIDPPGSGYLEVDLTAAIRVSAARDGDPFVEVTTDGRPAWVDVPWHAWHSRCRFDAPGENAVEQVELRNLTSWPDVARVTADLMRLRMFSATDWNRVLSALGAGEPGLLRAVTVEVAS